MRPQVIAHRGGAGDAPENTLAAFARARELGVDMVELDVHLSRDGHLMVIHDPDVQRTTDGEGLVKDLDLAQLRRLDAGSWFSSAFSGEKVPTLEEVVFLLDGSCRLNVEIKSGPVSDPHLVTTLVAFIAGCGYPVEDFLVSSFDHRALQDVHTRMSQVPLGYLFACLPVRVGGLVPAEAPGALHPMWALTSRELVAEAHELGLDVNAWTVNDAQMIRQMVDVGVDGIITDFPDRVQEIVGD